jgi:hypothetical protein
MITISIEIHFTAPYMADLGTRAEPLGDREGAQPTKASAEERGQLQWNGQSTADNASVRKDTIQITLTSFLC